MAKSQLRPRGRRKIYGLIGFICLVMGLSSPALAEQELGPEAPPKEAVEAYRDFWQAFSAHEEKVNNAAKDKAQKAWSELSQELEGEKKKLSEEELLRLGESVANYRKHLETHRDAPNTPYVALNLAQVLRVLAARLREKDPEAGTTELQEAMTLLATIATDYPGFERVEEAMYLHALILSELGDRLGALAVWQRLAKRQGTSIYSVHANVAVGDFQFKEEKASLALGYYTKAKKLLESNPDIPGADYELLRIEYRVAWAAYRAADLKLAVSAALGLLEPGRHAKLVDSKKKIEHDATELIGDSLFEFNDPAFTRATLKRRSVAPFAAAIGLRAMERYAVAGIHANVVETAEVLAQEFPAAKEIPDILTLAAASLKQIGDTRRQISVLEQLALLLPLDSLWRARHSADFEALRNMENKAESAARLVAAHHYEYGMSSGSVAAFDAASMYYAMLLSHEPNGPDSNQWRLKEAHCHYFADRLPAADEKYQAMIKEFASDNVILEVAAYQLALTRDKIYRQAFAKNEAKGLDPAQDPITIQNLRNLETAIEDFANRFPGRTRAVDLLLVGAAANRDINSYDNASKLWQRVMVSSPNPGQRSIAIRGLVMAKVKKGEPEAVMQTATNFLRLENWKELGEGLRSELYGVLARSLMEESGRLNQKGEALQAGRLTVATAKEFPRIPEFDRAYRDGAYMVAIGGDWAQAEEAAKNYLEQGYKAKAGDMAFLLARAQEYQMRFPDAAKSYLKMAQIYPEHPRSNQSLAQAEKLAVAESDQMTGAKAATILGDRATKRDLKARHYGRATAYYQSLSDWPAVIAVSTKRLAAAPTAVEKLHAELDIAKAEFNSGKELAGLKSLEQIAQKAEARRAESDGFNDIAAEANFLVGEENRRQFDDFVILEREGNVKNNVTQKASYFERMISRYERAAAASSPTWSSQALYQAGDAAQRFADELNGIPLKVERLDDATAQHLRENVKRLSALSKKYHGNNMLARSKAPALYKNNEWVKKSSIKLAGTAGTGKPDGIQEDQPPTAVGLDLPYQWSY